MLPHPSNGRKDVPPGRFAATAVPQLLDLMKEAGASPRRIRARLAGGASMFRDLLEGDGLRLGRRNVEAAREALGALNIPIDGEDVFGTYGRSVYLNTEDGKLLVDIIDGMDEFQVVAEASTGFQAIRMLHEANPDIITLDIEMPDLGGLETLAYIMSEAPRPVVIVSSHTKAIADLQAVDYGAVEVVSKPQGTPDEQRFMMRQRLVPALRAAALARVGNLAVRFSLTAARAAQRRSQPAREEPEPCAVAIAASTGGPRALAELIPNLPADVPAAVLIVQHMPPLFTHSLAQRLDELSAVPVCEASEGERIYSGRVYIAPGGRHMRIERTPEGHVIRLTDSDPLWGVRPAADILFNSVAQSFGPASVGVVLTGMGRDGAEGLRAIREVGGWTVVQDEESCVIASMPKAAQPYARQVLPLTAMAAAIAKQAAGQGSVRST
jgi:two-component system chemotaxis response regulator CheB